MKLTATLRALAKAPNGTTILFPYESEDWEKDRTTVSNTASQLFGSRWLSSRCTNHGVRVTKIAIPTGDGKWPVAKKRPPKWNYNPDEAPLNVPLDCSYFFGTVRSLKSRMVGVLIRHGLTDYGRNGWDLDVEVYAWKPRPRPAPWRKGMKK